ncbi:MAG: Pr6Pr family membrane protein [Streptosporangiaceae bacterium]
MLARWWHGVIAALVLIAIVAQIAIAIRVSGTPPDVTAGVLRGSSLAGRIIRVLSFFTIQSNLLSGIVSAQLAARPGRDGPAWRAVRLAALLGITVTGIVYSTVLAAIHQPHGATETLLNIVVHYLVPAGMVIGWLVFGPRPRITGRTVGWALAFPVLWLVYSLARGAIWPWYPYPFLDVSTHGYGQVAVNALLVTAVFAVLAAIFAAGDRWLPAAPRAARPDPAGRPDPARD